jgi:hypothetical protein
VSGPNTSNTVPKTNQTVISMKGYSEFKTDVLKKLNQLGENTEKFQYSNR